VSKRNTTRNNARARYTAHIANVAESDNKFARLAMMMGVFRLAVNIRYRATLPAWLVIEALGGPAAILGEKGGNR
jgi:hypothetical protein